MSWQYFLPSLAVMAVVTYLIRMLPLTLFRKPITSRFVKSFLYYVPYAVLTAMTVPDVLYSTGYSGGTDLQPLITAAFGLFCGTLLAWRGKSLLTVAIASCVAVALAQCVFLIL